MISKQIIRSSFRAVKASTQLSASCAPIARASPLSALRLCQSTQLDAKPVRWFSSSPRVAEEQTSSPAPAPATAPAAGPNDTDHLHAVYLSNLSFSITEELLTEFVAQFAPVKKVDVVRSGDGTLRGFGFAKFARLEDAEAAVKAINGLDLLGRPLTAAISIRRPVLSSATNQLFMSGFPTDGEADEGALRLELQQKLNMQPRAIRFHKFPGGFLKGTGHIEFDSAAMVETAIEKLQQMGSDQPIQINGHTLTLMRARPLLERNRPRGGMDGAYGGPRGMPAGFGGYSAQGGYAPGPPGGGYGGGAPSGGYGGGAPSGGYGGGYNAGYPGAPAPGGYGAPPYGSGRGGNSGNSSPY